ncbi:TPA: hypothetical protein DDZ02_00240 [candidate division WWE3 bacterium]|nr:hypothetical protein [candidate division WWE3 bacterium]
MEAINKLRLKTNIHILNKMREAVAAAFKNKKSRRIIILVTLAVLIPVTIFSIIRATRVKADWFDDSYNQRQEISFSHTSDISSERRISVTVNTQALITDGKMQTDCDDTIFTSVGGKLLKYTLVSGCNTTSTVYDVVVDSVTNGGNSIFMYYSNPIAHSTIDGAVSSVTSLSPSGAPSAGSEEIGPSPSMYLKFDEGYGGTAYDSTSNANNAALGDPAVPDQKLRQEINIIDHIATATGDDPSLVQLDTTKYSGTVTYYFEVVAQVSSGTLTVALERAGTSTQDSTVTVTETAFARKRSATAFTPPTGTTEYNINLANGTTPQVKSARILVFQNIGKSALTTTQTQIELGNYEVAKSNTTAAALNAPKYWNYTEGNWDGTKTFSAEVVYKVSGASGTASYTTATSSNWSAPSGVQSVQVEAWGAGGGGGGQNATSDGGGGGGGGAYVKKNAQAVTPGSPHTLVVGAGGSGGTSGAGQSGGHTYFINTSSVMAMGGLPGSNSTGTPPAGGLGGAASSSVGDVKFNGGQGEIGRNHNTGTGGYGGSSAGTASDGYSGPQTWDTATYPTASTPAGAGHGGDGGGAGANGSAPASGNGGGGGGSGDGTAKTGGSGADGKLVLTWTINATIILQEDNGSFAGWTDKATLVSSGTATSSTRVRVSFTPATGKNYRLVASGGTTNGTYDIYSAKIIVDQTSTTGVTKLENQYLLANTLLSSGSAPQNFDTLFDPAEIYSQSAAYYHEVNGANSSSSSLRLQIDPNGTPTDIANTTVTPSNRARSSAFSAPSSSQTIDVTATTNNNDIYSSSILSLKTLSVSDITMPSWQSADEYCVSGRCLVFDGSDDVVGVTDNEPINFGKKLNSGFTIQMWVRANTLGGSNTGKIFSKGANNYLGLAAGSNDQVVDLSAKIDLGTTDATLTVDDALNLNQWHLISLAYTNDSDDEISIYVDGVLKGTSINGDGSPATETNTLNIGAGSSGSNFDGYIDEFKIYAKERTLVEIRSDNIKYSPTLHGTSAAFGNDSTNFVSDGLTGYWKMDEGTGTTSADYSGNSNTATLVNSAAWNEGKYVNATSLDGVDDYVTAGSNPTLAPTSQVTVSGWVKMTDGFSTSSPSNMGVVDKGDYQFYMDKTDGKAKWVVNDNVAKAFSNIGQGTGVDNFVSALAVYNGNLYVGGYFTTAGGVSVNYIAKYNDQTNQFSNIGQTTGVNGSVESFAVYNGNLYIGGYFTTAGGVSVNYIAKYNDQTNQFSNIGQTTGVNSIVNGLAVYNGNLYVGGNFTTAGGVSVNYIAKYNDQTNQFSNIGQTTGVDTEVDSLAMYNGNLYVGGNLTTAGGVSVNYIAKYNDQTNQFSNIGQTTGVNSTVYAFAVYNGNLYVGGNFTTAGSVSVNYIAKYGTSNTKTVSSTTASFTANTWYHLTGTFDGKTLKMYINGVLENTTTNTSSFTLSASSSPLYMGKTYGSQWAGGSGENFKGRLDDFRTYNTALTDDEIYNLAELSPPSNLYYKFEEGSGTTTNDVSGNGATGTLNEGAEFAPGRYGSGVSFDGNNDFVTTSSSSYISPTSSIAVSAWVSVDNGFSTSAPGNMGVIDKGDYQLFLDKTDGKAKFVVNDSASEAFSSIGQGTGVSAPAEAFAVYNGNLYVGGQFTTAGGVSVNYIAKYNDQTNQFSNIGQTTGVSGNINALTVYNGNLYVGGTFATAGGVSVNYIAKYNDQTNQFSNIGQTTGVNSTVNAFAVYNENLYVGGGFTTAGGVTVNRIAKYNDQTNQFSNIGQTTGVGITVQTLAVYNGNLYVGGYFTTAGGVTVNYIAKYNDQTNTFSNIGQTTGVNSYVQTLAVYNGNLYVGGDLTTAGGISVNKIAKYNDSTNTFSNIGQTTGVDSTVNAFAVYNGSLYAGGYFITAGGVSVNYIAKYNDQTNQFSNIGQTTGVDSTVNAFAVYNGNLYVGGAFTTAGGVTVNQIAKYGTSKLKSVASTTSSWTPNTWYHLAGTFDGTNLKIYVNGVLENTTTNGSAYTIDSAGAPLLIGKTYGSQWVGGSGEIFKGRIDDVKIYNYPAEITQITKDLDAQYPSPDPTLGTALGFWRFDEGGGTTIYDRTGNSRNLTLTASPPTAVSYTVTGKFNKAFYPNGTNYASRDDNAFIFNAAGFALNLWFKSSSSSNPSGTEYVLGRGGNTTAGYALYFNTAGNLLFGVDDDTTWGPDTSASSPTDLYDGLWHNATAVKKDNTQIDLYIDGLLVDSKTTIAASGTVNGDNTLVIGGRGEDYSSKFNGSIDEVSIYNFDIGSDRAKLFLNDSKTSQWGAVSTDSSGNPSNSYDREFCVPGDTATCEAPFGHWKFDEGSWINDDSTLSVLDSSVNQYNLRSGPAGSGPTGGQIGKFGYAGYFDGGDDYLQEPTNADLSINTEDFSISTWIYKAPPVSTDVVIAKKATTTATDPGYYLFISSAGLPRFYISDGTDQFTLSDAASVPSNQWVHLEVVVDRDSTANTDIYVNGIKRGAAQSGTLTAVGDLNPVTASDFTVGAQPAGNTNFEGKIDNIVMYKYARTPQQINWEYNRGDATYNYKLNECSGNTANNSAQNSNGTAVGTNLTIYPQTLGNTTVGTCVGSANEMWFGGESGKFNGSLDFDGTDDYLASSNTVLLTSATSQPYNNFSFGAWVNPATAATSKTIIQKNNEFRLTTDSSNKPQCEIYAGAWQTAAVSSTALSTSTWSHVFCTYDGSNIKIYVNGVNTGTQAEADNVMSTSATALNIGRDSAGSGYFDGKIDEVSIHTMAFNDTLVKLLYNENSALRFGE